jgi:ceramide glucosyltransferase
MIAVLVLTMLAASWTFWLASLVCARRVLAPHVRATPWYPPVSILKPVRGLDFEARENFISHCAQRYPKYEVLFGVTSADEPVVPLIRELQRTYGTERVRLVVAPHEALNPKAGLLDALARSARYDVIVLTDSDVRLAPDSVGRIVAPLADPTVGVVTLLYRGDRVQSVAAAFEALGMEAEFLPAALVGQRVLRAPFALGPGNGIRRDALDRIGGFAAVSNYLADDYQLGFQVGGTGLRVEVGDEVISAVLGPTSLGVWWNREVRWARTIRMSRRAHYPGLMFTFATPLALFATLAFGWWPMLVGSLALRWCVGWLMTRWMGDRALRRWLWLLPLRDLISPAIFIGGLFGQHVSWRGRTFRVTADGKLYEPPREPTPIRMPT